MYVRNSPKKGFRELTIGIAGLKIGEKLKVLYICKEHGLPTNELVDMEI